MNPSRIKTPFATYRLDRVRLKKHYNRQVSGVSVYRSRRTMQVYGVLVNPGDYFPVWHFKPLAELYVPASLWGGNHVGTYDGNGREWRRRGNCPTTPPPNLERAA
jgi:hypothetical protein